MADTQILPRAEDLLACLAAQLALNPNPPAEACLRAGNIVIHDVDGQGSLDKVCCPGLAYVRIGAKFPSSEFPNPDALAAKGKTCLPLQFGVELVMGVVRCIPGMGTPEGPDCTDWNAVAAQDADDLQAMTSALCCWADEMGPGRLWLAGTSTVAITADCIERQWPVTMQVGKCCP